MLPSPTLTVLQRFTHMAPPRYTLSGLLRWASAELAGETPILEHSVSLTDDGGAPQMKSAAAYYLALQGHDQREDNWRREACRLDKDGRYRTPMRCALASINPPERRWLLRDLLANVLFPSDIAELHGIPRWAAGDVFFRSLMLLRERYAERPVAPERGWISGRSQAQRDAESAA